MDAIEKLMLAEEEKAKSEKSGEKSIDDMVKEIYGFIIGKNQETEETEETEETDEKIEEAKE